MNSLLSLFSRHYDQEQPGPSSFTGNNQNENSSQHSERTQSLVQAVQPFVQAEGNADDATPEEKKDALKRATLYFYSSLRVGGLVRQDSNTEFCRICREGESRMTFISPCDCKGSLKFVHKQCLETWLAISDTNYCELCGHRYTIVRTPKYGILKSFGLWLTSGMPKELFFDLLTFTTFTPVATMGTYLGVMAGEAFFHEELDDAVANTVGPSCARILTIGVISLMACIDFAYAAWLTVRMQYHFTRWYSWWRRNYVVRVVLSERCLHKRSLSLMESMAQPSAGGSSKQPIDANNSSLLFSEALSNSTITYDKKIGAKFENPLLTARENFKQELVALHLRTPLINPFNEKFDDSYFDKNEAKTFPKSISSSLIEPRGSFNEELLQLHEESNPSSSGEKGKSEDSSFTEELIITYKNSEQEFLELNIDCSLTNSELDKQNEIKKLDDALQGSSLMSRNSGQSNNINQRSPETKGKNSKIKRR